MNIDNEAKKPANAGVTIRERIVSMCEHKGALYIATISHLYELREGKLIKVEFCTPPTNQPANLSHVIND